MLRSLSESGCCAARQSEFDRLLRDQGGVPLRALSDEPQVRPRRQGSDDGMGEALDEVRDKVLGKVCGKVLDEVLEKVQDKGLREGLAKRSWKKAQPGMVSGQVLGTAVRPELRVRPPWPCATGESGPPASLDYSRIA